MAGSSFLADMDISPLTVEALRKEGWDIVRVSHFLPVNARDADILQLARRQGRVVVTQDLDFSALLALGGHDRPSLITLRLHASDPETVTRRLLDVVPRVETELREGCAVTIEDETFRVRRLPIRL